MFSLNKLARRNARIVAIGAAASAGFIASQAGATTLSYDPDLTPPASGGSGVFDNGVANFLDPSNNYVQPTSADTAHFGVTGGTVAVAAGGVQIGGVTFDVGGYNLTGGNLANGNTPTSANTPALVQNAGNNTIVGSVSGYGAGSANVAAGTLTVGGITNGNYGTFTKTGAGVLSLTGPLNTARGSPFYSAAVNNGTMILSTTANTMGGSLTVASAGDIQGTANTLIAATHGTMTVDGHIAPGVNTANSNFGGAGTFAIRGGGQNAVGDGLTVTFGATSQYDIDLTTPDSAPGVFDGVHDRVAFTSGNYGGIFLNITSGATVNISGTFTPGTYHIISLENTPGKSGAVNELQLTDAGFTVGSAPSGFSYSFADTGTGPNNFTGIDLIVAAQTGVPEPASLAMLGVGAGLLLARKRRISKT
jgi:hypothetical protein